MLDQRLLRDNPVHIASKLQSEGKQTSRQVGQRIQGGDDSKGPEVQALRNRGNAIKQEVSGLEEQEKALEQGLQQHWQIGEHLGLGEAKHSVQIVQSHFITLLGSGGRRERALGWAIASGRRASRTPLGQPQEPDHPGSTAWCPGS